jgi:nucleoside-diphosphate-sugar epimerase
MKVLVTGGTGFLGSHLVARLRQQSHDVVCVAKDALNAAFIRSLNVEVVLGDLNNGLGWVSILDDVAVIYHLAGVTRAKLSKDYYEGNYFATKRLVEVCSRHCKNLQRFVYVSSLAAAGPALDGQPLQEDVPCHPVSHYGKSKMLGELEVLRARDRLPITVVRPAAAYGPRDREIYQYFRIIQRGVQPLIGFGSKRLNLIHCDDLVEGILLAGEHPRGVGETYFLGSEENYTVEDISNAIARLLNRHPIRLRLPHGFVYLIGAIAGVVSQVTGKPIFFNLQKAREAMQPAWTCSVEKAKSQLGFRPRVSLSEGLLQTYLWFRENNWL